MNKEIKDLIEQLNVCSVNDYNFEIYGDDAKILDEYITNLQQENQQLKEEIKGYQQMYFDKVMIINKAIEMLEKYPITSKLDSDYILVNDLLETLKGDSNENNNK